MLKTPKNKEKQAGFFQTQTKTTHFSPKSGNYFTGTSAISKIEKSFRFNTFGSSDTDPLRRSAATEAVDIYQSIEYDPGTPASPETSTQKQLNPDQKPFSPTETKNKKAQMTHGHSSASGKLAESAPVQINATNSPQKLRNGASQTALELKRLANASDKLEAGLLSQSSVKRNSNISSEIENKSPSARSRASPSAKTMSKKMSEFQATSIFNDPKYAEALRSSNSGSLLTEAFKKKKEQPGHHLFTSTGFKNQKKT